MKTKLNLSAMSLIKWTLVLVIAVTVSNYTLAQAPIADFTASQTIIICDSSLINFTDLSTNSPTSWNWTFQGGTPSTSTDQNPNIWYMVPGTYDVTLVVSNAFGSNTLTKTGYINVYTPVVNLGPDTLISLPDTIILDAGPGAGYTYLWSGGSTNQTLNVTITGNYCVTVTDTNGCWVSDCILIDEMPTQPPIANFTCECSNDTLSMWIVLFTDLSINNPASWLWDFGDGSMSSTQNPAHVYWQGGFYTVTLTVTNILGSNTTYGIVQIDSLVGCVCYSDEGNISGKIFNDLNADCIQDFNEDALQNWLLQAVPGPYYAITNSDGFYSFFVGTGTYTISLMLQNSLWQQNCPVSPNYYVVDIISSTDTVSNINFGLIADIYCPDLSVNISTWAVRPCFQSTYSVSYCNNGTSQADNATIEVELDANMTYSWSNGNLISQNGNILTFDIDTVNPAQCGTFLIYVDIACNMSLVGQTMCVEAHIYPDSACFPADPAWDHSSVSVEGECVNDSLACFTIYNTGDPFTGDMQGTSEYRIYENNVLVFTGQFQLTGGNSLIICWPTNGNAIRLEADQRPGHPGNSHPQETIENCGDSNGTSLGQITVIPEDDDDNFIEIDCHVATGSYDPNDKQVKPEGLTQTYHFIDSTDVLEYIIHFQNTGTDTAFNVMIRDTLSAYLDITTIEPGSSSHPYTLDIFGSNILCWTFSNILLPDSNVNEPASNGFLKYKIHQMPGNTEGTVIENHAGIIFDFNEPVITNMVFNTVGNIDSIVSNTLIIYDKDISVKVYPNPFNSTTTFEIKGINETETVTFELYNIIGKQAQVITNITKNKFIISRENLPDGIYIYKISSENKLICAGKLIVN
ncbi:MAG: PKD domain-containing protein [Bacteroidales bacterium]